MSQMTPHDMSMKSILVEFQNWTYFDSKEIF